MRHSEFMKRFVGVATIALLPCGCSEIVESEEDLADGRGVEALTQSIPSDPNYVAIVGNGRNSLTEQWANRCLVSGRPINSAANNESRIVFDRKMNETELEESFQLKASAKATFGLFSGSARSSFTKATRSNSRSVNMVYKASIVTNTQILDEWGSTWHPAKEDPAFYSQCGDTVVRQVKQGGEIYLLVRMDFASESDKQAFETAVGASYGASDGQVEFAKQSSSFVGRATVHVEAYQIGGEAWRLSHALNPESAITCKIENFAACEEFMKLAFAIRYTPFVIRSIQGRHARRIFATHSTPFPSGIPCRPSGPDRPTPRSRETIPCPSSSATDCRSSQLVADSISKERP